MNNQENSRQRPTGQSSCMSSATPLYDRPTGHKRVILSRNPNVFWKEAPKLTLRRPTRSSPSQSVDLEGQTHSAGPSSKRSDKGFLQTLRRWKKLAVFAAGTILLLVTVFSCGVSTTPLGSRRRMPHTQARSELIAALRKFSRTRKNLVGKAKLSLQEWRQCQAIANNRRLSTFFADLNIKKEEYDLQTLCDAIRYSHKRRRSVCTMDGGNGYRPTQRKLRFNPILKRIIEKPSKPVPVNMPRNDGAKKAKTQDFVALLLQNKKTQKLKNNKYDFLDQKREGSYESRDLNTYLLLKLALLGAAHQKLITKEMSEKEIICVIDQCGGSSIQSSLYSCKFNVYKHDDPEAVLNKIIEQTWRAQHEHAQGLSDDEKVGGDTVANKDTAWSDTYVHKELPEDVMEDVCGLINIDWLPTASQLLNETVVGMREKKGCYWGMRGAHGKCSGDKTTNGKPCKKGPKKGGENGKCNGCGSKWDGGENGGYVGIDHAAAVKIALLESLESSGKSLEDIVVLYVPTNSALYGIVQQPPAKARSLTKISRESSECYQDNYQARNLMGLVAGLEDAMPGTQVVSFVDTPVAGRDNKNEVLKRQIRARCEHVLVGEWIRFYINQKAVPYVKIGGKDCKAAVDFGSGTTTLIIKTKHPNREYIYKNSWKGKDVDARMKKGPGVAFKHPDVTADQMFNEQEKVLGGLVQQHLEAMGYTAGEISTFIPQFVRHAHKKQTGDVRDHFYSKEYKQYLANPDKLILQAQLQNVV